MTFKANNDDIRESLSFKVKKNLEFKGASILWHDPYLEGSADLDDVLSKSDIIVVATPHREYQELKLAKPHVDIWGLYRESTLQVLPGLSADGSLEEVKKKANA